MKSLLIPIFLTLFIAGCGISNQPINNDNTETVNGGGDQSLPINDELPTISDEGKLKAIDCEEQQRNVDACIEIYQPVCGQLQIQCITTPCDPIKETFANSCKACSNPNVLSYTMGACSDSEEIRK